MQRLRERLKRPKNNLHMPFGDIKINRTRLGSYEVKLSVNNTHVTKYYKMVQRPNNTLQNLTVTIRKA